jgi:hypothetical protein
MREQIESTQPPPSTCSEQQLPTSLLPAAGIAALVLCVLFLASWLTNRRFGHATYHRGAPLEGEAEEVMELPAPVTPVAASNAKAAAAPSRGPPLQEALPQELLVDLVLPFLTPYEVVTGFALCNHTCWAASEAPGLWARFAHRAGLLRLLLLEEHQQQRGSEDSGAAAAAAASLGCVKSKLEFFRRAFLLPYALTKGHGSVGSCRVVVHGAAYDVTNYLGAHPGGEAILLEYGGGLDATTVFELALHSAQARRKMAQFLLWDPAGPACLGTIGLLEFGLGLG